MAFVSTTSEPTLERPGPLPATLTIESAVNQTWGAIVVGAGPAGSLAARELARRGLHVLLLDKAQFPRDKVCGGCLNTRTMTCLDAASLGAIPAALGARHADRFLCHCAGFRRPATLRLPGEYVVTRRALDAALVQAAIDAGVEFIPGATATLGPVEGDTRQVLISPGTGRTNVDAVDVKQREGANIPLNPPSKGDLGGCSSPSVTSRQPPLLLSPSSLKGDLGGCSGCTATIQQQRLAFAEKPIILRAQLVLASDGLQGGFLQRGGLAPPVIARNAYIGLGAVAETVPCVLPAGAIAMACAPQGYVGVSAAEDNQYIIAAALAPAFLRQHRRPADAVAEILARAGVECDPSVLRGLRWKGTPPLTRRSSAVTAERVLVLGDASGYIEPFTGEGMAWAMEAALALGPLVEEGIEVHTEHLERAWTDLHRRQLARRQRVCKIMRRMTRHPRLLWLSLRMLRHPALGTPILRYMNQPV